MPAYSVAANCNSQATQSITMHEFPQNRPVVKREKNGSNLYNSNELTSVDAAPNHAHLCSEHFAECNFINFMAEYQMGFASKQNL